MENPVHHPAATRNAIHWSWQRDGWFEPFRRGKGGLKVPRTAFIIVVGANLLQKVG
jgi:hypothetical protein